MDTLNPWLLLIAGLVVGALVGGLVILLMERRSRGNDHDIRAVRRQLDDYRQEVAEHYVETAKRVNDLTHAYKSVYDHLENGAYRLVGEDELRRRLDDRPTEPVMLEGIGQRSLQGPQPETDDYEPREPSLATGATAVGAGAAGGAAATEGTDTSAYPAAYGPTAGDPGADPSEPARDPVPSTDDASVRAFGDADGTHGGYAVESAADPNADEPVAAPSREGDVRAVGDEASDERPDRDAEDEARRR